MTKIKLTKTKMTKLERREHYSAIGFISIKYLGFAIFTLIPIFFVFMFSFTKYNPIIHTGPFLSDFGNIFVGFDQYEKLFTHEVYAPIFREAFFNTVFLLLSVPLGIIGSLFIATLLCNQLVNAKIAKVMRSSIYLPVVASAVAMSIIWRYIFDNDFGLLNMLLGTDDLYWLSDPWLIKIAIVFKNTLLSFGGGMILFSATIMGIAPDYYEVADLCGATGWQKFKHVTLPFCTPVIFYLSITGIIGHLQSYVDAEIFAQGQAGARTIVYLIWTYGIKNSNYGLASAASVILFLIILGLTLIQFKLSKNWVFEG